MFLLWFSAWAISGCYLLYVGLQGEQVIWNQPISFMMLVLLIFSTYQLTQILILYARLRERGWRVSLPVFLFNYDETGLRQMRFIPARDEFQITPEFDEKKSEMANLLEALYLARGWDSETRLWRELVPVYTPKIPQTIELVQGLLRDQGILAVIERPNTESTYGSSVMSGYIAVPKAQHQEAVEFLREYFENNENELSGIH